MGKRIHFIGIGGIGISALARYFFSQGWSVSGSDLVRSSITDELLKEGIRIFIGHSRSLIRANRRISRVIYNQAITDSNSELKVARQLGIPCQSYPEAVGLLTQRYKTIAVAGAHGKSTTTALISLILIEAKLDPTVIIGTKLREFHNRNFRLGKGEWLVLEADEWKGSFWHYSPTIAVITNIDKEHLDFYKTFANVKKSFVRFINNIKPAGTLVINQSHANVLKNVSMRVTTFSLRDSAAAKIKKVLQVSGEHNVLNALAAYRVGRILDIPEKTILKALGRYQGAWRRMEYRGQLKTKSSKALPAGRQVKAAVYDDYAHHPTEIKATLAGMRQKWPKNRLICVFQAHQVERLNLLFSDFKRAFKDADEVVILPTYEVAGRERIENRKWKVESKKMSQKLAKAIKAIYLENPKKELRRTLETLLKAQSSKLKTMIVMMGAGDIVNYTKILIH